MRSFDAMAAWRGTTGFNLATGDSAEYVKAMPVSKEFFQVFGVRLQFGEPFGDEHDRPAGPTPSSSATASGRGCSAPNPAVVGTAVTLGDRSYTVLGVMPRGFVVGPAGGCVHPAAAIDHRRGWRVQLHRRRPR